VSNRNCYLWCGAGGVTRPRFGAHKSRKPDLKTPKNRTMADEQPETKRARVESPAGQGAEGTRLCARALAQVDSVRARRGRSCRGPAIPTAEIIPIRRTAFHAQSTHQPTFRFHRFHWQIHRQTTPPRRRRRSPTRRATTLLTKNWTGLPISPTCRRSRSGSMAAPRIVRGMSRQTESWTRGRPASRARAFVASRWKWARPSFGTYSVAHGKTSPPPRLPPPRLPRAALGPSPTPV
jgi:hypothetical protein